MNCQAVAFEVSFFASKLTQRVSLSENFDFKVIKNFEEVLTEQGDRL